MSEYSVKELIEATGGLKEEDLYIYRFKPLPIGFAYLVCPTSDRIYGGGNRGGKTYHVVGADCGIQFTGRCPQWLIDAGYPKWRLDPRRRIRIGITDKANKLEDVVEALMLFIPQGDIKEVIKEQGKIKRITNRHGGFIEIMSYATDTQRWSGVARDFIVFDEVPPPDVYKEATFRFGSGKLEISFAATPLTEEQRGTAFHPYFRDLIVGAGTVYEKVDGKIYKAVNVGGAKHRTVFYANVRDNKHVNQEEVDKRLSEVDPVTALTRETGKLIIEQGRIYRNFRAEVHVVRDFDDWWQVPDEWSIYVAIDVAKQRPHSVTILGVYKDGRAFVCDEIEEFCYDTQEFVDLLQSRLRGQEPVVILIDALGKEREPSSGKSFAGDLAACGLRPVPRSASKLLVRGIPKVRQWLGAYRRTTEGKWWPEPRVFVQAHCQHHIRQFLTYSWMPPRKADGVMKEEPFKKDEDFMENMNRLLNLDLRFARDEVSMDMVRWQGMTVDMEVGRNETSTGMMQWPGRTVGRDVYTGY